MITKDMMCWFFWDACNNFARWLQVAAVGNSRPFLTSPPFHELPIFSTTIRSQFQEFVKRQVCQKRAWVADGWDVMIFLQQVCKMIYKKIIACYAIWCVGPTWHSIQMIHRSRACSIVKLFKKEHCEYQATLNIPPTFRSCMLLWLNRPKATWQSGRWRQ